MTNSASVSYLTSDLVALARSGQLFNAIDSTFGATTDSAQLHNAKLAFAGLADGDKSVLPSIEVLNNEAMTSRLGAYSSQTDTIYLNSSVLAHHTIALEVLTHELGHAIASRYFTEGNASHAAYEFTHVLLGQDHALALSSGASHKSHDHSASDQLTTPNSESPVALQWFDTALHIDWAREQLPMLNAQAFDLLKLGQNDSDAFWGPTRIGIFSPYGLHTDSSTHFDNNNVRGSIEAMRKRWSNGIVRFNDTEIGDKLNLPFVDKSLVGPGFDGANAGVENLLYRFGQITHAFQDFYSHSNWVEMVRAGDGKWLSPASILDAGLDLPVPLNPGTIINNAPNLMVAMSGPDYDASLVRAGVGLYATGPKSVYWWVNDRQDGWGEVFANPKSGGSVGGLMTGSVNSAIYYDTNYSVPLRAIDRAGFFDVEYYRGFSHGGLAGEVIGQWMSPLSKDKPDNGRFADKSANAVLFEDAQAYASLQVRHDFDRMGNLIFKNHGIEGLQKFAHFSIIESERDLFVATYSQAGARWDWTAADRGFESVLAFMTLSSGESDASHDSEDEFHFDESNMRFVEVFYAADDTSFMTHTNRAYLTQVNVDGRWFDAAAGLINTHHDHAHDYGPEAFLPATTQHTSAGGRTLYSDPNWQEGHYLGTVYSIVNINTNARVFINHFDVGLDIVHVVDEQGRLLEAIDVDRADYPETRQYLLDTYNIKLNARPETEVLNQVLVIRSALVSGAGGGLIIEASDFFAAPDTTHANAHNPATGIHTRNRFAGHDETRPWLVLLDDGTLSISDISQVPQGVHEIYVSVTDGAGLLEGAMITLAVDPVISVGHLEFANDSVLAVNFVDPTDSAVGLFAQIFDERGLPVSFMEHLGVRIGDASGLPPGFNAGLITTNLADPVDHGEMVFYAMHYKTGELAALEARNTGQGRFSLFDGNDLLAELTITDSTITDVMTYIDEIYLNGLEDVLLGIPLNISLTDPLTRHQQTATQVNIQTTAASESYYSGTFGFFIADLQSGHIIDPRSGVKLENLGLKPDNVRDYSAFFIDGVDESVVEGTHRFTLDPHLNLNNLGLFPYYQVDTYQGSQLFLGGAAGVRDGVSHIARVAQNTFGVEDLIGNDYDFDDFMLTINSITVTHIA